MAINVKWSITDMKRDAGTGGVKEVRWQCLAYADTGETAVEAGKLTCTPDPDSEAFIAYEELTEDVVVGWVRASLGDEATTIENVRVGKVEAQIARKAAEANGLPW